MAVLSIDYCGGNYYDDNDNLVEEPIEYKGVRLFTSKSEFIFNSGDFLKDWYGANKKFFNEEIQNESHLAYSSSVNDFTYDGAEFDIVHLIEDTDRKFKLTEETISDNIIMFVPKGKMLTFEELQLISK